MECVFNDYGGFESYAKSMARNGSWGDNAMLAVASYLYKRPINIISDHDPMVPISCTNVPVSAKPMYLGYIGIVHSNVKTHYVSLLRNLYMS